MPSIISYRKFISPEISRTLALPQDEATHQPLGTELATLEDGTTYVALPDGATLPAEQPAEITASIAIVTLTAAEIAAVKKASPHVRLIDERVRARIRERYSIEDEVKMLRLAPSSESTEYNAYVESCRQWGADQRMALGV